MRRPKITYEVGGNEVTFTMGKGTPVQKWDMNMYRHTLTISKGDKSNSTTISFFDHEVTATRESLIDAIDCVLGDYHYAELTFMDFCDMLGYDAEEDEKIAMQTFMAIARQRAQFAGIGLTNQDIMDLADCLSNDKEYQF